ncbi:MAG: Gldg family protein [Gemmatimonadota bacterium]
MLDRILTVARRELRSYFDHPTAYILLVVFLVTNFFFFFRSAYLLGEASLRPMFNLLPWLLLFFVPAVTMRSLAEERRSGTIELILAQPLTEMEFLLGKFLGVLAFLAVALAGTLGAPLGLSTASDLAWGVALAQYAGSVLLTAALAALGLWTSSTTRNQVTAFILGVGGMLLLYLLSLPVVLLSLPPVLATAAERLGLLAHFQSVSRGVIDLRDVLYFASVTGAFLALAYFSLLRHKLSRRRRPYRRLVAGTVGLIGIAILASLLGAAVRGRLDLTPGRVFSLSPATRSILGGLDDVVTVKLFTSRELPPEFTSVKRDVEDLLRDFDAAGGGELRVVPLYPGEDEEARSEASRLGVPPIEFNVVGQEEFSVRQGYLGIALQYAGQTQAIPVVQRTADLEYRLASAVRSLTRERPPVVAFLQGHGEEDVAGGIRQVGGRLQEEYAVESLRLDSLTTEVPDSVDVVVLAGPKTAVPREALSAVQRYLDRGGSLMLLASSVEVDQANRFSMPSSQPLLDSLIARFGVTIGDGLAYDLRLNARLPIRGEAGLTYVVPYPPWPMSRPATPHPVVQDLSSVLLPWPSPLDLSAADTTAVVPLLATSEFGGRMPAPASIDPTRDWAELALAERAPQVLAVAAVPPPEGTGASGDDGGTGAASRLVVVGSPSFASGEFLRASPDNLTFFQNAIDWLAQDEALIAIRSKDRTPPRLLFRSAVLRDGVKYGNLAGVPLLFVLLGILRLARRRRLHGRRYGETAA